MATTKRRASDELIAELNAGLHSRDPMRILKQQIRLKTLAEVREHLIELRAADGDSTLEMYPRLNAMLEQMEQLPTA